MCRRSGGSASIVVTVIMLAALVGFCRLEQPAHAQIETSVETSDEPVLVTADLITFDQVLNIVIAEGNVEISQEERLLRADRVTYNQRTDVVTASGNVIIVEPTGDVFFADYAELDGDLASGFVDNVRLLMADDSRMAGNSGVRRGDRITEVERAVYSPCQLCPEDPTRPPLWQLRAVRVIHDGETRDVIYRDAFLDMFGLPVIYTPYLSHPDPTVEQRSGFLPPSFGGTTDLGAFILPRYYWAIGPDRDATFSLGATGDQGLIAFGEYRQRFESASLQVRGSVNSSDRTVDVGTPEERIETTGRGHLFADARIDIDEHWRAGGQLQLTSDDTYLDVFGISDEDVLENRVFAEGFYGLSYALAEVRDFTDLREGSIDQPTLLPRLAYNWVSEPGAHLGGQLMADLEFLNLERDTDDSTRRISAEGGWQRELVSDFGLLTQLTTSMRGDVYWIDEDNGDASSGDDDNLSGRLYPLASATVSMPFVRSDDGIQQTIEPIVGLTAATAIGQTDDIPNNDSLSLEFDHINLFSPNRFTGLDVVEEGVRVTYGLRYGLYGAPVSGTLFLGQSYRIDDGGTVFPEGSGLEEDASDVVGRLSLSAGSYFDIDWRFRIDPENLQGRRQEITASGGVPEFRVSSTYTFIDELAGTGFDGDREEIVIGASSRLSEYWSATASFRRDLAEDANRDAQFGLIYSDECFTFSTVVQRDFTENRDRSEGLSIFFTIGFRNLGEPLTLDTSSLFE